MIKKNNKFSSYQLFVSISVIVSLLVISLENLNNGFKLLLDAEMQGGISSYFSILIIFVFSLSLLIRRSKRFYGIYIILLLYFLYIFFSYNFFYANTPSDLISSLLIMLWLFCFKLGGDIAYWDPEKLYKFILSMNVLVTIPLMITAFYFYYHNNIHTFKLIGNDAIFAITVYLPFIFMLRTRQIFKLILLFAFLIISFLSYKRSIILAVIASTLTYIYFSLDKKQILNYIFKWYTIIVIIGSAYLYKFFKPLIGENIVNRFNNISNDKGSGRVDIYNKLLDIFHNSNGLDNLFGHGFQSTKIHVGMLAHNDFIQIAFDFGLIGASLYLIFIFYILKLAIRMFRYRKMYMNDYASYIGGIILFLIMTQLNCFIYSPALIIPIMFFLGISYFKLNLIGNYQIIGAEKFIRNSKR